MRTCAHDCLRGKRNAIKKTIECQLALLWLLCAASAKPNFHSTHIYDFEIHIQFHESSCLFTYLCTSYHNSFGIHNMFFLVWEREKNTFVSISISVDPIVLLKSDSEPNWISIYWYLFFYSLFLHLLSMAHRFEIQIKKQVNLFIWFIYGFMSVSCMASVS